MVSRLLYHVYLNQAAGFIYSFISAIFFLSNFKTLKFLSHFSVRPTKLKLDTHMGKLLIYCVHQLQAARIYLFLYFSGERGGSVVECRTPEREVRGSRPTAAVLCPWARHFTPRKYWLITQEAMAPSRYDWKIVDWDVKPQHNQPTFIFLLFSVTSISKD